MNAEEDDLKTLLTEQRREVTAAQDMDFAFHLQMQEAMSASLSLSSSSTTTPPPLFLPSNDDVSISRLLSQDLSKLQQQCLDHEQAQSEMNLIRQTLNQRAHDRAFALELSSFPEEEWRNTGDYFARPFGEEGCNSVNKGGFRVYFKGLVKDGVGGIGVAICDGRDELVLEVKKGLCEGDEEVVSEEVVEVRALIEGLKAAIVLGLKTVTVICADRFIYQYIAGKGLPRQSKVATLVDQLMLLQRNFSHCNPSLVAQKDIRFAYELAWEAIVSQVTRPDKSSHAKNLKENCTICLEDINIDRMFLAEFCLHRYCFSCMNKHVHVKLLHGMLPKCPHEGCKSELKIESCKKFLTPELFHLMIQHMKEATIPVTEKIYCPYPSCSALMSKIEIQVLAKKAYVGAEQAGATECIKCHGLFCINCKVPWHNNLSCDQYKRIHPYPCAEDAKLKSLATRNLWRQCVKCNHMVELAQGCYHIYCRCGNEFCYTCGAEWKNKKATCTCRIWDERNIIYNNNNRYQRRRV